MAEKFFYDFYQIPHTGVEEPELSGDIARADGAYGKTVINRPVSMKISNFGASNVSGRLGWDYTRTNNMAFQAKGESEDVNAINKDMGIGQNVRLFGVTVNHNPYLPGSSVKFTRDDQFVRMNMSRNTGSSTAATEVDMPKFDIMDSNETNAEGILASSLSSLKNWPSEGWRSFGGKYDFSS